MEVKKGTEENVMYWRKNKGESEKGVKKEKI